MSNCYFRADLLTNAGYRHDRPAAFKLHQIRPILKDILDHPAVQRGSRVQGKH